MNSTLALANVLDAQLNILNIEGICSEHEVLEEIDVWTDYETCTRCEGDGEVKTDRWGEWDDYQNDIILATEECPNCQGYGETMQMRREVYQDSWTTSNIII